MSGRFKIISQNSPNDLMRRPKYQAWLPRRGAVTWHFKVSGWRDLNPRPLRPERAWSVTTSVDGCCHVLAGRRIVCSGGTACQRVADFLLTPFGLAP